MATDLIKMATDLRNEKRIPGGTFASIQKATASYRQQAGGNSGAWTRSSSRQRGPYPSPAHQRSSSCGGASASLA